MGLHYRTIRPKLRPVSEKHLTFTKTPNQLKDPGLVTPPFPGILSIILFEG